MKAGWALGGLCAAVLGFVGICQTGLLGRQTETEAKTVSPASQQEILATPAGWRYLRGQPSHWKYLMMRR